MSGDEIRMRLGRMELAAENPWTGEERAREIAREEVASLCGLVLERLGRLDPGTGLPSNELVRLSSLKAIFGEALRDFGGTPDEPGPA